MGDGAVSLFIVVEVFPTDISVMLCVLGSVKVTYAVLAVPCGTSETREDVLRDAV
jgi:hypothetical protein